MIVLCSCSSATALVARALTAFAVLQSFWYFTCTLRLSHGRETERCTEQA